MLAKNSLYAIQIAKQVDYLGGTPSVVAKPRKTFREGRGSVRLDLENEQETIANYRLRIRQAEALEEYALSEILRRKNHRAW